MAVRGSAAERPAAELNVTPMLDVLLVLLVIFMLMAMRTRQTIDAQLPVPCGAACDGGEPIVLEVLPGPTYRLNRTPVSPADLAGRLAAVYAGRPDRVLQVAGRPGVTYQQVIGAMDVARGAGARVLGLMARDAGSLRD